MAEIEHDISLDGEGTANNPLKVKVSTAQSNILSVDATGVYLSGTHRIIPKFTAGTLWALFNPVKTFPDGSILLRDTMTLKNPQHTTSMSGISQYSTFDVSLGQYFLDEKGNPINTQISAKYSATSTSEITATVTVIMSAMPTAAYDIFNDTPWPPSPDAGKNFAIKFFGIVGYTPSQMSLE